MSDVEYTQNAYDHDDAPGNGGGNDRRSLSPPGAANGNGNGVRRMDVDGERERERESDYRRSGPTAQEGNGGDRGRDQAANPGSNLHVSGLSPRVEQRDLEEFFGKIGQVQKASVMYDPHTRDSRGFGFVMMQTEQAAQDAIAQLDKKELQGKIITVTMARRARARTPTPGKYFGPPKGPNDAPFRRDERPYQPRSYDSRYASRDDRGYDSRDRYDRYDSRGGGGGSHDDRRYDDRRGGGGGYDDYRPARSARDDYPSSSSRPAYDDRSGGGAAGGATRSYSDRPPREARY